MYIAKQIDFQVITCGTLCIKHKHIIEKKSQSLSDSIKIDIMKFIRSIRDINRLVSKINK